MNFLCKYIAKCYGGLHCGYSCTFDNVRIRNQFNNIIFKNSLTTFKVNVNRQQRLQLLSINDQCDNPLSITQILDID